MGASGERARGVPRAPLDLGIPVARVLSIATDLMLASRVDATLTAAGHHVILSASLEEAPLDEVELIVADLDVENPGALVGLGVPVLGYYSHGLGRAGRRLGAGRGRSRRASLEDGARTAGFDPAVAWGLSRTPSSGRLRLSVRRRVSGSVGGRQVKCGIHVELAGEQAVF